MISQNELVRRFVAGYDTGIASNMTIRPVEGGTEVVGYGWAIYAHRDADTGHITIFDGWRGYSVSTNQQLGKIRPHADEVSDASPRARSRPIYQSRTYA